MNHRVSFWQPPLFPKMAYLHSPNHNNNHGSCKERLSTCLRGARKSANGKNSTWRLNESGAPVLGQVTQQDKTLYITPRGLQVFTQQTLQSTSAIWRLERCLVHSVSSPYYGLTSYQPRHCRLLLYPVVGYPTLWLQILAQKHCTPKRGYGVSLQVLCICLAAVADASVHPCASVHPSPTVTKVRHVWNVVSCSTEGRDLFPSC